MRIPPPALVHYIPGNMQQLLLLLLYMSFWDDSRKEIGFPAVENREV